MRKKVLWGVVIFVALVVAWIPAHYVFAYMTGDRWNETQWSAAGAWVGAGAAAFLACVSVWQTRKANEQARQVTKQARDDAVAAAIASEAQRVSDLKDAKDLSDAQLNQAKESAREAKEAAETRRKQDAKHHGESMQAEKDRHAEQLKSADSQLLARRKELEDSQQSIAIHGITAAATRAHNAAVEFLLRMSRPTFIKPDDGVEIDRMFSNRARFIAETNLASLESFVALTSIHDHDLLNAAMNVHEAVDALNLSFTGDMNEVVDTTTVVEHQKRLHEAKRILLRKNLASNPSYLDVLMSRPLPK